MFFAAVLLIALVIAILGIAIGYQIGMESSTNIWRNMLDNEYEVRRQVR